MQESDSAKCMKGGVLVPRKQRSPSRLRAGETVRHAACGTGAALGRSVAAEICQTAKQTAAAGEEESEFLKIQDYFSLKVAQNE